jgi:hypothetical protein
MYSSPLQIFREFKRIWDSKEIKTKMTLQDSSGKVEIQGQLAEAFDTERSLIRVQYCSG